jgi:hypothetical protein
VAVAEPARHRAEQGGRQAEGADGQADGDAPAAQFLPNEARGTGYSTVQPMK